MRVCVRGVQYYDCIIIIFEVLIYTLLLILYSAVCSSILFGNCVSDFLQVFDNNNISRSRFFPGVR